MDRLEGLDLVAPSEIGDPLLTACDVNGQALETGADQLIAGEAV